MNKILFITCVDLKDEYSGITRKVMSQYMAMSKKAQAFLIGYWGDDVKIIMPSGEKIVQTGMHRRICVMGEAIKIAKNDCEMSVYVRRFPVNPLVLLMLKQLRRACSGKIVWEIPTFPYDFEGNMNMKTKIIRLIDRICRIKLKKYIDRIVTFSQAEEIFDIKTIITGNGIDVSSVRERYIVEEKDEIHMIGVAVLNKWHGYDRLIKGIGAYKASGGSRKVVFHLVGDGPCMNEYMDLINKLEVKNEVILYGYKNKNEIDDIYDKCDIAVDSLGWHRSNVEIGTSLKTREYMAKGMAIIASTPMDMFLDGWEYAYYASIDDSLIDIYSIIKFYDRIHKSKTKQQLANEIRRLAFLKCDMQTMMEPCLSYILE